MKLSTISIVKANLLLFTFTGKLTQKTQIEFVMKLRQETFLLMNVSRTASATTLVSGAWEIVAADAMEATKDSSVSRTGKEF
jgi:hypothetical protein